MVCIAAARDANIFLPPDFVELLVSTMWVANKVIIIIIFQNWEIVSCRDPDGAGRHRSVFCQFAIEWRGSPGSVLLQLFL